VNEVSTSPWGWVWLDFQAFLVNVLLAPCIVLCIAHTHRGVKFGVLQVLTLQECGQSPARGVAGRDLRGALPSLSVRPAFLQHVQGLGVLRLGQPPASVVPGSCQLELGVTDLPWSDALQEERK